MSNPWFRLYAELANDPKVLVLTEALRWRYVSLLCIHCNGYYENRPNDEIALSLRVTVEEWEFSKQEFIKRGLLDADGSVHGWAKRQYISDVEDPTAAQRQKRYRDKKKEQRNAPVTSRSPEADTDTDTEHKKTKDIPPALPVERDETELQSSCRKTWAAYSDAYQTRYGTAPVRNAKINAQVKQFCQRLTGDESPDVAAFFVGHNAYAQKAHPLGLLLADAEKLRMEWVTNRVIPPKGSAVAPSAPNYGTGGRL